MPLRGSGIVSVKRDAHGHYQAVEPPATVAGPIIAYRVWKLRTDGVLLSVTTHTPWPLGTPIRAWSEDGPEDTRGIYAVKTMRMLDGRQYGRDCIAGAVALWGHVFEHRDGYRAEYAYPFRIDLSVTPAMPGFPVSKRRSDLARMIRDNYGCEVIG